MKKLLASKQEGFTLIEILVVIGIIAILAVIVLVAINPGRQFAQSRNTQRTSNVNTILNAIGQNMADNKGNFTCATAIPSSLTLMQNSGGYDIRSCLVPNYVSEIPVDPQSSDQTPGDGTYLTGYRVMQDSTTKRVTVEAPSAELSAAISITR